MFDKATARALVTRAHPSLLVEIRPEHVHIRRYVASENAKKNGMQTRWMSGYTRFGDEMEAAFAQASGKNPRLLAESAATYLEDPWMMRGKLREEMSPGTLAVFENLHGGSKKVGSKLLHSGAPDSAVEIAAWLGRYDIRTDSASTWTHAISSYLMFDGMGVRAMDRRGQMFSWEQLLLLARSGATPEDITAFYRRYKVRVPSVMRHFVDHDDLDRLLDREALGRTFIYHEYKCHDPRLRKSRDGYARLSLESEEGLVPVGPGTFEAEVVTAMDSIPGKVTSQEELCMLLGQTLEDPWMMFGTTTNAVPRTFRKVWDSLREWAGRLSMVSLLDVSLPDVDADRYIEWLGDVSSWRIGSPYSSWEGLVLAAATENAAALHGPYGYRSPVPLHISREDLYRIMDATDPVTLGAAAYREHLDGKELLAHFADGIPLDYVLAMR